MRPASATICHRLSSSRGRPTFRKLIATGRFLGRARLGKVFHVANSTAAAFGGSRAVGRRIAPARTRARPGALPGLAALAPAGPWRVRSARFCATPSMPRRREHRSRSSGGSRTASSSCGCSTAVRAFRRASWSESASRSSPPRPPARVSASVSSWRVPWPATWAAKSSSATGRGAAAQPASGCRSLRRTHRGEPGGPAAAHLPSDAYLRRVLASCEGNVSQAAGLLGSIAARCSASSANGRRSADPLRHHAASDPIASPATISGQPWRHLP